MEYRNRVSLDGVWAFLYDAQDRREPAEVLSAEAWREAQVPMPWQVQFEDLQDASGTVWYRRAFSIQAPDGGAVVLHFGAADYFTTVWLNGQPVGEHEGGYLPFEFDVAPLLQAGENELLVRVVDPGQDPARWPDYPFIEIPHGKQSWYGPIGGLWQSVWVETRPALHLNSLRLTPDASTATIEVTAATSGSQPGNAQVRLRVQNPSGGAAGEATIAANQAGTISLDPAALQLWSPESPALYQVTAELLLDGSVVDQLSDACGFRTVEIRDKRIYLNGQPIYLRSALDQAYYPETVYTPPSLDYLEDQARKAKELGLNCLRIHIKVEDPRYYEVADRLGLLIWTEIPNWVYLSPEASRRAKETFAGMVERDWNHPSIFCWSLVNENWGTDLTYNPEHRAWLAQFFDEAKAIDPTRLVVDNSACYNNLHVKSDLDDVHDYRAIPDHAAKWDEVIANFANRLDWSWSADYLENRHEHLPLILSEFGNWGLPDPRRIQEKGGDPWWFETGYNFGDGIVYPHGMLRRFEEYRLKPVFGSFEKFVEASQEHMARSLAYEISTMRLHSNIGGYVVTEFTDVHWECNGLMTMQREIKDGLDRYFVPINQNRVVVLRPQRWSGRPGETLDVQVSCSGIDGPERVGVVRWQAGAQSGEIDAPGGVIAVPLPADAGSALIMLRAQWIDENGQQVAENLVELASVAPAGAGRAVTVFDNPQLAEALHQMGYHVGDTAEEGVLIIASTFTEDLRSKVQAGARLLILASPESLAMEGTVQLPLMGLVPRAGSPWQGDWATSFSWLRKDGPFASLPGGPLLEMEYAEIMPDAVLAGTPAWVSDGHVWAGLALGWIHKVVSLLTNMPYGRGVLTVTTFKFPPEVLARSAVAQNMLAGLIELAGR
jgi:hypothetical protein